MTRACLIVILSGSLSAGVLNAAQTSPYYVGLPETAAAQCIGASQVTSIANTRGSGFGIAFRNVCQYDVEVRLAGFFTTSTWRSLVKSYEVVVKPSQTVHIFMDALDILEDGESVIRIEPQWELTLDRVLPKGQVYSPDSFQRIGEERRAILRTHTHASDVYYNSVITPILENRIIPVISNTVFAVNGTWTGNLGKVSSGTALDLATSDTEITLKMVLTDGNISLVLEFGKDKQRKMLAPLSQFITGNEYTYTFYAQNLSTDRECAISYTYILAIEPQKDASGNVNLAKLSGKLLVVRDQAECGSSNAKQEKDLVGTFAYYQFQFNK